MAIRLYRQQMMPGAGGPKTDLTLFVGPVTCAYHNCGMGIGDGKTAVFCPSDVQYSLGNTEDATIEAAAEFLKCAGPEAKSLTIFTSCKAAFVGVDLDALAMRAREELGILCIHKERNRILQVGPKPGDPGGPGGPRPGGPRGEDSTKLHEQLFSFAPQENVTGEHGILVLAGPAPFDQENELVLAARSWGFDWVMGLGDIDSLENLERVRGALLLIAADEAYVPLAQKLGEQWDVDYLYLPISYSLEAVDQAYEMLANALGPLPEMGIYRASAAEALDYAASACSARGGAEVELSECLVDDLRRSGVDVTAAEMGFPFGGPGRPPAGPPPQGEGRPPRRGGFRSGDAHFPTSGPGMRRGSGGPPPMPRFDDLPEQGGAWGYYAVYDCAKRLAEEVVKR